MYNNINTVRSIDLPDNLFSNLGETNYNNKKEETNYNQSIQYKPFYNSQNSIAKLNDKESIEPKLINLSNKSEYRERMDNIYNEINDIEPIDNEINSTMFTKNYNEKGIVVKPKLTSLKQFWTEFRLISNEKNNHNNSKIKNYNFDELFSQLSNRVKEINEYIDELKTMRISIEETSNKLEEDRQKLEEEKRNFMSYKMEEEEKIKKEKENIKINYNRLQNIIDDLNNKINSIE